jgi:hypothetical protein
MRYFGVFAALITLLFLASCGRGEDSYTETEETETTEAKEQEVQAPHPPTDRSVDPDRRARIEEEKKKEEEQENTENERSKLGKLLDSLGDAMYQENSVEKAKVIAAEIGPLYEKFRKEDEGPDIITTDYMNKFKQQMDKLTSYLEKNDIGNAKTCLANLGYYWSEWKKRKMVE